MGDRQSLVSVFCCQRFTPVSAFTPSGRCLETAAELQSEPFVDPEDFRTSHVGYAGANNQAIDHVVRKRQVVPGTQPDTDSAAQPALTDLTAQSRQFNRVGSEALHLALPFLGQFHAQTHGVG